jgi:hypothetical protein
MEKLAHQHNNKREHWQCTCNTSSQIAAHFSRATLAHEAGVMMNSILIDPEMNDEQRRQSLYEGQLIVHSPTFSSAKFVQFADEMIKDAFKGRDPESAQFDMEVAEYAGVLAELKPKFIHHPESKALIRAILDELGCDLEKTYFDVPRMRSATSGDYLSTGIAYAFHPHRDTWYSAPMCQVNWWIPIYRITSENGMAFHPQYWSQKIRNGSREYNYAEWNRTSRLTAAQHIKTDTRKQPKPEEPIELDPQIRVVLPPGAVLMFSAAQLHSTVPNTSGRTRFSIDFRTVHLSDVLAHRGAPNIDSECTGTTMRDYLRATDLAHVPQELIAMYDTAPAAMEAAL